MSLESLPELVALDSAGAGVRIPPDLTVPLTPRVRRLIDTAEVRRLARVSQLGLVSLVYPGATHGRLEHSLGVYRLALEFLRRLRRDERFRSLIDGTDATAFVAAALLHDLGHWAFCHPLEDMGLAEIPRHESLVAGRLAGGEAGRVLREAWDLDPARVASLIDGTARDPAGRLLRSLLSGPIDVDKMDYLVRDSLHAGVPYGRHFDQPRLLSSLCTDESGLALAITAKGRTAAELLVFARYVMFSEVYWHHAVRAATAMLQRSVWLVRERIDPDRLVRCDDEEFRNWIVGAAAGTTAEPLVAGLFGPVRRLFKRAAAFDALRHPEVHRALAGRPYAETASIAECLAGLLARHLGEPVSPHALLIDAAPAEKEVEFRLQVREREGEDQTARWHWLEDLSPVVRSLAREQFDDLVKRVRIFAPPDLADRIVRCPELPRLVLEAAGA